MGCCVPNVEQISLSFEVVLLRLEPQEQSNTFLIREITKDTFEKEDGMTFIDCCLSSNDQTLSKMFTNKNRGGDLILLLSSQNSSDKDLQNDEGVQADQFRSTY